MFLDILLTTTNKNVDEILNLVKRLNIVSNVIVGNQAKENNVQVYYDNEQKITIVNTNTKGCSKNRNNLLNYSSAELVIFADDDEVFTNNYLTTIISTFAIKPDADAIYFAVNVNKESRPVRIFKNNRKARWKDISALGVWGLVIKRKAIDKYNLKFDDNFGPGSPCPMGEDSIYLKELLNKTRNVYTSTMLLAYIEQFQSTWFKGYTKEYFVNLGKATKRIFPKTFLLHVLKNTIYYTKIKFNPFKVFWWMARRK